MVSDYSHCLQSKSITAITFAGPNCFLYKMESFLKSSNFVMKYTTEKITLLCFSSVLKWAI